jgi:hypothetical protein
MATRIPDTVPSNQRLGDGTFVGLCTFFANILFSPRRTTGIAELSVERARRDTEKTVPGGKPTFGNFGGHPKATAADKKAGGNESPPLTIVSVSGVFDYGFFTGFLGARFVAAGFLT